MFPAFFVYISSAWLVYGTALLLVLLLLFNQLAAALLHGIGLALKLWRRLCGGADRTSVL